ncbi:hypothetical protein FGIG_01615 [Fasciola gigantica]|uniref:CUB domain-containing protein n=1 Tax=Fasciola gigantica TaxID=46835 RepID=A0A504Y766_FASGI|nr:hypothetical protein FGIG_01615 [Fasciola gigantica]
MLVIANTSKMELLVVFLSAILVVVVKSDPWECKDTNVATATWQNITVGIAAEKLPPSYVCDYHFTAPKDQLVELKIKDISVGSSATCVTEYVIVRGNVNPQAADKKYCGTVNPAMMEFSSNVYVQIKGDRFSKYDAFDLIYVSE